MMLSANVRRLTYKAVRQSIPLITAILCASIALALYNGFTERTGFWRGLSIWLLLVPMFFPVGIGTTLVSMERESKGTQWLISLPVRWQPVVFTPLVVALVELAIFWCIVFGIHWTADFDFKEYSRLGVAFTYYVFHSFYLLICGFTAAWLVRSPLPSLLCVIPLAAVPAIIEIVRQQWLLYWDRYAKSVYGIQDISMPSAIGTMGACGVGMLAIMSLAGRRAIAPQSGGTDNYATGLYKEVLKQITAWAESFSRSSTSEQRPMYRMSTLLWGYHRENRNIFRFGQLSIAAFAYLLYLNSVIYNLSHYETTKFFVAITLFLLGIFIVTIPVLTFQTDSMRDRVRFLTERGISPRELWWSRQLVMLGFASLFIIILGLTLKSYSSILEYELGHSRNWSLLIVLVINTYCLSQWIGQMIPRVTVAIFISLIAVLFSAFSIIGTRDPLWSIAIGNLIMLFATYRMMRPWMERRINWRYYLGHAKYIAAFCLIHYVLKFAFFVQEQIQWGYPRPFSSDLSHSKDWHIQASSIAERGPEEDTITLSGRFTVDDIKAGRDFSEITDRQKRSDAIVEYLSQEQPLHWEELANELLAQIQTDHALHFDPEIKFSLPSEILSFGTYLKFEALGAKDDEIESAELNYHRWVALVTRLTGGLRRSHVLLSQEIADHYEVWLIKQCLDRDTRRLIDSKDFAAICELVGNKQRRWHARKEALLATYWKSRKTMHSDESWFALTNVVSGKPYVVEARVVGTLCTYIDAKLAGEAKFPADELNKLLVLHHETYSAGPNAAWLRIDDARRPGIYLGAIVPVAMLWGGGWETQGEQLRTLVAPDKAESTEVAP